MGSQFEELAKAVARGTSRRRILQSMLGGLVGAVAAAILPSGRTEAVEIASQSSAEPTLRQVPRLNQAPIKLNQAPVKINQSPVRLNQSGPFIPQGGPHINQRVGGPGFNSPHPNGPGWNQRGHTFNQTRPPLNQQFQTWINQHRGQFNQGRPGWNQGQPWWNQSKPGLNQRGWPPFNQRGPH